MCVCIWPIGDPVHKLCKLMNRQTTLRHEIESAAQGVGGVYFFLNADEEPDEILSISGVQGVILPARDLEIYERYPNRVGWVDWTLNEIKIPQLPAKAAVGFFRPPDTSLMVLRSLRASGVIRIGYFSSRTGRLKLRPISVAASLRIAHVLLLKAFGPGRSAKLLPQNTQWIEPPTVTDTMSANESTWRAALARINWLNAPMLSPKSDFIPRKLLIITGSLGAGGSERQIVYTALGLREIGLAPKVVVTNRNGSANFFGSRLEQLGISVTDLPQLDLFSASRPVHKFRLQAQAMVAGFDAFTDEIIRYANLFEQERPSVVHTWLDWPNCAAGLAALAVGVPRIVLSGRSLSPEQFGFLRTFMRPAYEILAKSSRVRLINNSRAGADDYARWLGIPPAQIRVIPNAIDPTQQKRVQGECLIHFRKKHGLPENAPIVGTIFRMTPEKRPMLWLDIAAHIAKARPDVRFLMVGGGPELDAVKARARELGLIDSLALTGETSDVATPLGAMSCFLLTSRVEGLPNVLLESQLAGVPVVTSAVGGAPETVDEQGLAGSIVSGDNPEEFAEAVLDLLKDSTNARRRENLTASVLQRFGLRQMIERTKDVYNI